MVKTSRKVGVKNNQKGWANEKAEKFGRTRSNAGLEYNEKSRAKEQPEKYVYRITKKLGLKTKKKRGNSQQAKKWC